MPTVVLVAVGSRGDVQPYVALGVGLADAGIDVLVATHERFRTFVAGHRLGFAPIPADPYDVIRTAEGAGWEGSGRNPLRFATGLAELARPLAEAYLDACVAAVDGADLVLFSPLGVGAHHAAEAAGIRRAGAWLQPLTATSHLPNVLLGGFDLPRWSHRPLNAVVERLLWAVVVRQDGRWRRALGLEPLGLGGPFPLVTRGGLPVLYGMSRALVPPPPDWPDTVRVTGAWFLEGGPLPAEVVEFLDAGPPPIVMGFGSRLGTEPDAWTDVAVSAARRVGARLLLLTGWGGVTDATSDDVLAVPEAPHDRLLPRAAAIVHHGGAGTTHAGARAGIPSLVVPGFADQYFWAERIRATGAGMRLDDPDVDSLTLAFSRALHQPWPRARRVAERIAAEDGVATAVREVDRLLA